MTEWLRFILVWYSVAYALVSLLLPWFHMWVYLHTFHFLFIKAHKQH